ncbi:hypothetical protein KY284_032959 [Solanum tuberosum]|nr:hypothetical protein KY284_032959 [Solanum tuberosum]
MTSELVLKKLDLHGRLMFKIQFGRNSKLRATGTGMSYKIVVLLLTFLKELKSLRSCMSCSYDWHGTTHLILAILGKENLPPPFHPLFAAPREKYLEYFHFISDEKAPGVRMAREALGVGLQTSTN